MKPSAIVAAPLSAQRPTGSLRDPCALPADLSWASADAINFLVCARSCPKTGTRFSGSCAQPVLVELAALHDRAEMLALLLEQAEVLQRIAVHDDEIGVGARLQRADFSFHAHDPRAD